MFTSVRKLWTAALRSGDYKQGKGSLSIQEQFCCLGVLSDIFIKEHPEIAKWGSTVVENLRRSFIIISNGRETNYLHQEVMDWAGLSANNPMVGSCCMSLAQYNDNGSPFEEIADLIDASLAENDDVACEGLEESIVDSQELCTV